jgi:hypothetical protein
MMRRLYQWLLRLYPREVRTPFAPEMADVFSQLAEDRRCEGWVAFTRFVLQELGGLLIGAAAAYRARRRPVLDLRKMRPPDVSREVYVAAVDEVLAAQRRVAFTLDRMQRAIARNDFSKARFYSDEDHKARENLKLVRRKYRVPE